MTVSARNWSWDAAEVRRDSSGDYTPLKPGEKLVLLCLAEHENAEHGYSYPSQERIADRTCLSVRSVRTHLVELERLGVIAVEKRRSKQGRWLRNVYILAVPDDYRLTDKEWMREQEGEIGY